MDKLQLDKKINETLAKRRQNAELDAISYRAYVMRNADYAALDRRLREKELEDMKLNFSGKSCAALKSELKRLLIQKNELEKKLAATQTDSSRNTSAKSAATRDG